jgi:lipopolysaccharide biosynthesis glycosyltransferase
MPEKGLITIAIGKKYVRQAKYLACSCMLNSPHILRSVITDHPEFLTAFYDIIIPFNREYEDIFSLKTRLHLYTPFEKTLYLDADSLVVNNIDSFWEILKNCSFAYEGAILNRGEWYFNIEDLIKQLNLSWLPKFNSGMFLFDRSEKTSNIFDTAYFYFVNHKKENINVPFFKENMYPDEPFLAIALAKNNIMPIDDYGRFSRTLINARKIHVNIIKRISRIFKNGKMITPLVIHFCGKRGGLYYLREKLRLFFYFFPSSL